MSQENKIKNQLREYKQLADQGDPEANFAVAQYYCEHYNQIMRVINASDLIQRHLLRAIDGGNVGAMISMGSMYKVGNYGIKKDIPKALEYYELAVKTKPNHPDALSRLGFLECTFPELVNKGFSHLKQAADLGYSLAQLKVANMYLNGNKIPRDLEESLKYYGLAAQQGDENALSMMAEISKELEVKRPPSRNTPVLPNQYPLQEQDQASNLSENEEKKKILSPITGSLPKEKDEYSDIGAQGEQKLLISSDGPKPEVNPYYLQSTLDILLKDKKAEPFDFESSTEEKTKFFNLSEAEKSFDGIKIDNPLIKFKVNASTLRNLRDEMSEKGIFASILTSARFEIPAPYELKLTLDRINSKFNQRLSEAHSFLNAYQSAMDYLDSDQYPSSFIKIYIDALSDIKKHINTNWKKQKKELILSSFEETESLGARVSSSLEEVKKLGDPKTKSSAMEDSKSTCDFRQFINKAQTLLTSLKVASGLHSRSETSSHFSIRKLSLLLDCLDELWMLENRESIKKEINSTMMLYFSWYEGISLSLERCLKNVSDHQTWLVYSKFQRGILDFTEKCLLLLEKFEVKKVSGLTYYSIDTENIMTAGENSKDPFNKPFDLSVLALKAKNKEALDRLNIKDITLFLSKQKIFSQIRSLFYYEDSNGIQEIDQLTHKIGKENPFFMPYLLMIRFHRWLEQALWRNQECRPEVMLCVDIPELLQFFQHHACSEKFFRDLVESWWQPENRQDPFYASLNIYAPVTQLALFTQIVLRYMIDVVNRVTDINDEMVAIVHKNYLELISLQRNILSFFSFPKNLKPHLNAWCFFNQDNHAILYSCPINQRNDGVGTSPTPPITGFSFKNIQEVAIGIEKYLMDSKESIKNREPRIVLAQMQDVISNYNIELTRSVWGKNISIPLLDINLITTQEELDITQTDEKEINKTSDAMVEALRIINASLKKVADDAERLRTERSDQTQLKSEEAYQSLNKSLPAILPQDSKPVSEQKKKKKNKKKKKPKKDKSSNQKVAYLTTSTIVIDEKKAGGDVGSEVSELFIKARNCVWKPGNNPRRHQEMEAYVKQIEAYVKPGYKEGVRIDAFLILRDLYAFIAFKKIDQWSLEQAMVAISKASDYYQQAIKLPSFISNEVYAEYRSFAVQSSKELLSKLNKFIKKLENKQERLEQRAQKIKEHRGLHWWVNHRKVASNTTGVSTSAVKYVLSDISPATKAYRNINNCLNNFISVGNDMIVMTQKIDPSFEAQVVSRPMSAGSRIPGSSSGSPRFFTGSSNSSSSSFSTPPVASGASLSLSPDSKEQSASSASLSSSSFSSSSFAFMSSPTSSPLSATTCEENLTPKEKLFKNVCQLIPNFEWKLMPTQKAESKVINVRATIPNDNISNLFLADIKEILKKILREIQNCKMTMNVQFAPNDQLICTFVAISEESYNKLKEFKEKFDTLELRASITNTSQRRYGNHN